MAGGLEPSRAHETETAPPPAVRAVPVVVVERGRSGTARLLRARYRSQKRLGHAAHDSSTVSLLFGHSAVAQGKRVQWSLRTRRVSGEHILCEPRLRDRHKMAAFVGSRPFAEGTAGNRFLGGPSRLVGI